MGLTSVLGQWIQPAWNLILYSFGMTFRADCGRQRNFTSILQEYAEFQACGLGRVSKVFEGGIL